MSDLRELYQQLIIDHGRKPRNYGRLENANHIKEGFNPLCGDKLTVYIIEKNGLIEEIKFEGAGCAISMASASLMTQSLKGKSVDEFQQYFKHFHELVTQTDQSDEKLQQALGKLAVLAGVAEFPSRVKCATLCWHTTKAALDNEDQPVSTES